MVCVNMLLSVMNKDFIIVFLTEVLRLLMLRSAHVRSSSILSGKDEPEGMSLPFFSFCNLTWIISTIV